jgi:hypothetical protein
VPLSSGPSRRLVASMRAPVSRRTRTQHTTPASPHKRRRKSGADRGGTRGRERAAGGQAGGRRGGESEPTWRGCVSRSRAPQACDPPIPRLVRRLLPAAANPRRSVPPPAPSRTLALAHAVRFLREMD